jgi:pyruvate,water dikinase
MTDQSKWVYFFGEGTSEGDPADRDMLGGKGASLAAMSRAGLPVPPGFTISAELCPLLEQRGGEWPDGLEQQVRDALARLEKVTNRPFGQGDRPLLVAVRSGAAVSMPGMMDTILNCGMHPGLARHRGDRDPASFWKDYAFHIQMFAESVAGLDLEAEDDDPEKAAMELLSLYEAKTGRAYPLDPWNALCECIDAVFRSFNSERARTYREHNNIRNVIGTAVNVQAMFPSERAGILFTANPNNIQASEMVMDASWGLGEVVVSGAVTPDSYVLDAETLEIKHKTVPHPSVAAPESIGPDGEVRPALTDDQIREVVEIGRKVEAYMGVPQDIEWGLADGRFNLLQTRNIRNLDVLEDVEVGREAEIERLLELAEGRHVVWVTHNLGETLRTPTPLTWDLQKHFMSGRGGYGLMFQEFGYQLSDEVLDEGFLELICGRIYTDTRRAPGLFYRGLPGVYDPDEVLADPSIIERPPQKIDMENADPTFFAQLPGIAIAMIRASRRLKRIERTALSDFVDKAVPRLEAYLEETSGRDLLLMPTPELLEELDRRCAFVLDDFGKEYVKPGYFAGRVQGRLQGFLEQLMGDKRGAELTATLTAGLDGDITIEQNALLYQVAQGEATVDQFLDRFGHRSANEMELRQPRWREAPGYIERTAKAFRSPHATSPEDRHHVQAEARREATERLRETLAEWGGATFYEDVIDDVERAQALLPYRETSKYHFMRGYETLREVIVEFGRRWNLGSDVFFLTRDELRTFEAERNELTATVADRKLRWKSFQKLTLTNVIDSEHLDRLGRPKPRKPGEGLEARSIASGVATGTARIILDPQTAGDLGQGYVLVCPSTDPGWTPLFVNAAALVVERGGSLSHGAIVARDFGIPAVVCEGATELIPDGATVEVDGNSGAIGMEQ